MKKSDLIKAAAARCDLPEAHMRRVTEALLEVIGETLHHGDKVSIEGFGTFKVKERGERQGRNPATGESITIPATRVLSFAVSQSMKDLINGRREKIKDS